MKKNKLRYSWVFEPSINERIYISTVEKKKIIKFKNNLDDFIANTHDYPKYAEKILKWFKEYPDSISIRRAYNAVKKLNS